MYILGISAYYHDSAAVVLKDESIVAAVQEERFTRVKQDASFPVHAIKYVLEAAGISLEDVEVIVFYDKPFLKFERLLETYLTEAPRGLGSFLMAIPVWLKEKLFLKETLAREFLHFYREANPSFGDKAFKCFKRTIMSRMMFSEHHLSHAASAFYPSAYEEAAILTIDGVGEWTTTSLAYGRQNHIEILQELHFPHSLGLLYSAFTYYTGFKVNSGEYKVMGLAPYGVARYASLIKENLIDIKEDGSFRLNMAYFNYTRGVTMTNDKFHRLFGAPARLPESALTQREMDIAASLQAVTEEIVLKLACFAKKVTGADNLCLAGGVALNCVANGRLLKENIFKNIWVQPAAGDAGGALGAAYAVYHLELQQPRTVEANDRMRGAFLGPQDKIAAIQEYFDALGVPYRRYEDESELLNRVCELLSQESVVGWHQGRMEFGPRALGGRSILGDPRSRQMQSLMNKKIKFRESFRPFAPAVLLEKCEAWFDISVKTPYMLFTAPVADQKCHAVSDEGLFGLEKLSICRSEIPAVTHVDHSARVQTVDSTVHGRFYRLLSRFENETGCPVLINTSFNIRGEPIVCSVVDSYRCFMNTGMDVLVVEDFVLLKTEQPGDRNDPGYFKAFKLD